MFGTGSYTFHVTATSAFGNSTEELNADGSTTRLSQDEQDRSSQSNMTFTMNAGGGFGGGSYSGNYNFNVTAAANTLSNEHEELVNGQVTDRTWSNTQSVTTGFDFTASFGGPDLSVSMSQDGQTAWSQTQSGNLTSVSTSGSRSANSSNDFSLVQGGTVIVDQSSSSSSAAWATAVNLGDGSFSGTYDASSQGSSVTDQYGSNSTWSSSTSLNGDTLTTTGDETTTTIDAEGNSDTTSYSYSDTVQVDSAWAQTAGGNPPGIPSPGGAAAVLGWIAAVLPGFQLPSDDSGGSGDPPPPTTTTGTYNDGTRWSFTDDGSSWSYEERDANGNVTFQQSGSYDSPPSSASGISLAQQALNGMGAASSATPPNGAGSGPLAQRIPNWVPGTRVPISDGVYRPDQDRPQFVNASSQAPPEFTPSGLGRIPGLGWVQHGMFGITRYLFYGNTEGNYRSELNNRGEEARLDALLQSDPKYNTAQYDELRRRSRERNQRPVPESFNGLIQSAEEGVAGSYGGRPGGITKSGVVPIGPVGRGHVPNTSRITGELLAKARKEFEAAKPRAWMAEAARNAHKYSAEQLARMRRGLAPIGADGFPMEIHHRIPLAEGGTNTIDNFDFLTRTDHRLGPNYKRNHPNLP